MITFRNTGDFSKTEKYLMKCKSSKAYKILDKFGREGVAQLAAYTPVDTGKTASLWDYSIDKTDTGYAISWYNMNVNKHVNIALILQYGHATRSGSWVEGVDYINPALQPIFDKMANAVWEEVTA